MKPTPQHLPFLFIKQPNDEGISYKHTDTKRGRDMAAVSASLNSITEQMATTASPDGGSPKENSCRQISAIGLPRSYLVAIDGDDGSAIQCNGDHKENADGPFCLQIDVSALPPRAPVGPQSDRSPLPLRDRVAIVTGGSGGIGSEICTHLASLGARVVVGYLGDPAPADVVLQLIDGAPTGLRGPRAVKVEADVSDELQVAGLFERAQQAFGAGIHIVVTAAGVQDPAYPSIADASSEQWERMFSVNTKGTFLCCREAARRVAHGGGGRIITMSSSTVGSLREGYGLYASTKAAIEVMTRVMAKELRGTGITANAVAPGPIATPMFYAGKTEERVAASTKDCPMGRLGRPTDVAPVVGFLATDAAEWLNGQVIRLNGGYV